MIRHRPALPAPDFLRPQRRPNPLPALWAATGLLVLAIAAGDALAAWQARGAALARADAAGRPAASGAGAAGRPAAVDAAGTAGSVGLSGAGAMAAGAVDLSGTGGLAAGTGGPSVVGGPAAGAAGPSMQPASTRPSAGPGRPARAADPALREAALWRQRLAYPWPQVLAAAEAASVDGVAWLGLDHAQGGELRLDGRAERAEAALDAAQALRSGPARGRWPEVQLARLDAAPDGQRFELLALPAEAAAAAGGRP